MAEKIRTSWSFTDPPDLAESDRRILCDWLRANSIDPNRACGGSPIWVYWWDDEITSGGIHWVETVTWVGRFYQDSDVEMARFHEWGTPEVVTQRRAVTLVEPIPARLLDLGTVERRTRTDLLREFDERCSALVSAP